MSVAERLSALGVTLPAGVAPLAIYRPAVRTGHLVYGSGQIASRDGEVVHRRVREIFGIGTPDTTDTTEVVAEGSAD